MTLTTQRDMIHHVAKRWRQQYEPFEDDFHTASSWAAKRLIAEKLDALDGETATHADVCAIIGNDSWTRLTCDECGEDVDAVLSFGDDPEYGNARPSYSNRTVSLCRSCVEKADSIVSAQCKPQQTRLNPRTVLQSLAPLVPADAGAISLTMFPDETWFILLEMWGVQVAGMDDEDGFILDHAEIERNNPEWKGEVQKIVDRLNAALKAIV